MSFLKTNPYYIFLNFRLCLFLFKIANIYLSFHSVLQTSHHAGLMDCSD